MYGLHKGRFFKIIETEAKCCYDSENPYEQWDYFVYRINNKVVDTIYGKKSGENSCIRINDAIDTAFTSKGKSRGLYESSKCVHKTSSLFVHSF